MSTRQFMNLVGSNGSSRIHTCLVFGGYSFEKTGEQDIPYDISGAAKFAEQVRALGLTVRDWRGTLDVEDIIEPAIRFISESFEPRGKLIIYGYSAGGMNALHLAHEVNRRLHTFVAKRQFRAGNGSADGPNDVIIDLLITIDAYHPDRDEQVSNVGRNVLKFINIYQTYPQSVTGSRGWRLTRDRDEGQRDCNQDRSARRAYRDAGAGAPGGGAHAIIDEDTHQEVFERVEALISSGPAAVRCP
jgi:hypothetical protein